LFGFVPETTANRLHVIAVNEGLRRAPSDRPVRVYTAAEYLHRGATEWIAGWQRNGWRTRDGQPVKNQDAWRELAEANGRLSIYWHFVKGAPPPELARAMQLAAATVRSRVQ
jgi:ribonuclease HI